MKMTLGQGFVKLIIESAGRPPTTGIGAFLETQEEIRQRLGDETGLLDSLLEMLPGAVDRMDISNAGAKGFEAGVNLAQMVRSLVRSGKDILEAVPFIMAALRFMEEHPLPYLDEAQQSAVYYLAMADAWGALKLREFEKELHGRFCVGGKVPEAMEWHYVEMCRVLGGNELPDRLTREFFARQFIISPLEQYAQGLACHLNREMLGRVHEGGVTSLQRWLDRGIGVMPPLSEKPKQAPEARSNSKDTPDVKRRRKGQHQAKK